MSIESSPDGWKRFGSGRRWRCASPRYLCEVDDADHTPSLIRQSPTVAKMRRVKAAYLGTVSLGLLDEFGTGVDILVANAMTESYGTVPSPLSTGELREALSKATGIDNGVKLDEVVRYVHTHARFLERREPGYVNPLKTPGRVSVGAHHVLIATALPLAGLSAGASAAAREGAITDLVCRLPAESLYAAALAVRYFNDRHGSHQNQPPLLAATYNAGSLRPANNAWNLRQYGEHIDRWVSYYNTSRLM